MKQLRGVFVGAAAAVLVLATAGSAWASGDTLVTVGSPLSPFSQNKQNEPAIAIDANHPLVVAAGSNDEIDTQGCNGSSCPFTPGVGVSGIYFSFDGGKTWTQPTYTGFSARNCLGGPCTPTVGGPIGTLPWYFESGLVSDGDPAVAFGPKPGADGKFSWANGSRLYYANLTSNFGSSRKTDTFPGFEAIGVSRTDDVSAAAASDKNAWMRPVIASPQSQTTFSDKDQIWADNASSSPFFGTVYVCWASFTGQEKGKTAPAPLQVAVSTDGGNTWTQRPISAAANNSQRNPVDGCTIRTDSHGNAYLFGDATSSSDGKQTFDEMSVSRNGGQTFSTPRPVVGPVIQPGAFDPVQGRPVIDGIAGARSDLAIAPSVDIANGAPTGSDATNRIVMSYVSGGLDFPQVEFSESANGGNTWSVPRSVGTAGDRGIYAAPAISPNGTDVYVVYNAFTNPFEMDTTTARSLVGVVLHATVGSSGTGAFTEVHRGTPGDPRGASANALTDEFLGDYVYAAATRTYGSAVWNDARNAAVCPAVDAWRAALQAGNTSAVKPSPLTDCPPAFGNSDIYGWTSAP
jgi:hypothetical protein